MFWANVLLPSVFALLPGGTLHVPGQHATIQVAIDAAGTGDTVLVAPGIYVENIDFKGKAITVTSSGGPSVTTIDGNQAGSVVSFVTGESQSSVIEGFTITNGTGTFIGSGLGYGGGGIYCSGSSPTIRDNVVTGNTIAGPGNHGGGGIACLASSSPHIARNTVSHNSVSANGNAGGGGIICMNASSPTIVDSTIFANSCTSTGGLAGGGGIVVHGNCAPTIARNRIFRNTTQFGGGIQCNYDSVPTIVSNSIFENTATVNGGGIQFFHANTQVVFENNTVYGNTAQGYGGGIYCNTASNVVIRNAIVWNNTASTGSQIAVLDTASLAVSYSDVQGGQAAAQVAATATLNWGSGMLDQDPKYANAANGDFLLLSGSSCIDAGDPASQPSFEVELYGNPRLLDGLLDSNIRIDMGAHEFGNVHLEVTGPASPGTALQFETTGKPGLPVFLVMTTAPGQFYLPPFGGLLLDPTIPWLAFSWGAIPSNALLTIPVQVPTPQLLVFQELAINPTLTAGNVSNAVQLTIR